MDMSDYVEAEFCPRSISAIGINNTVALLYKLIGFKTKKMNQWFLPNRDVADSKLIVGNLSDLRNKCEDSLHSVIESGMHPTYKYSMYSFVKLNSNFHAVVIGRKVSANGASAFRITELFYDLVSTLEINAGLMEIIVQNGYEYIDFVEYGFDAQLLVSNVFIQCSDNLFLPHLFEPFVAERKEVKIAFKSKYSFSYTKLDSDRDRPNQG